MFNVVVAVIADVLAIETDKDDFAEVSFWPWLKWSSGRYSGYCGPTVYSSTLNDGVTCRRGQEEACRNNFGQIIGF